MHLASALRDECLCFSAIFLYLHLFIFRSVFFRVSVLVVFVHFLWWCLEHLNVAGLWTLLSIVLCVWLRDIWCIWYTFFGVRGTDERKDLLWWFCFTWSFLLLVLLVLSRFWCFQVHCRCHDVGLLQKVSILHCRKTCVDAIFLFSCQLASLALFCTQPKYTFCIGLQYCQKGLQDNDCSMADYLQRGRNLWIFSGLILLLSVPTYIQQKGTSCHQLCKRSTFSFSKADQQFQSCELQSSCGKDNCNQIFTLPEMVWSLEHFTNPTLCWK